MQSVVIVGASVGGVAAAKMLRSQGYDGDLHLVGAEPDLPYDRPPLSKGYLLGQQTRDDILLARPEEYASLKIDLHLGTRADRLEGKSIVLSGGQRIPFDRALLATGSRLRRLEVPGGDLPGIHYLRTVHDARELGSALGDAARVVVVGGGFIGLEVAAVARHLGKETVLLEATEAPLGRVLPLRAAESIAALHQDHGVRIVLRAQVTAFEGDGHVRFAVLADGRRFPCDVAVVGVGTLPNDELCGGAGHGLKVDGQLRTTIDGVHAAGDVARFPYRGRPVRIEHWDIARSTGEFAARAMLGDPAPFEASPFFWSDQYDVTFQYFGYAGVEDDIIVRGDPAAHDFIAFFLRDGAIAAALTAGRPRDVLSLRRLVDQAAVIEPQKLASEDVSLKALSRRL